MKFLWILCVSVLLLSLQSGCMIVPVPADYPTNDSRENIDEKTSKKLVPQKTTFEDVVLLLGEPDIISTDGNTLTYRLKKTELILLMASMYSSGESHAHVNYDLELNFNNQGVLTKTGFQKKDTHWWAPDPYEYQWSFPYFALLPKIPFEPSNDLVLIKINDNRNNMHRHNHIKLWYAIDRDVVIDPSESELLRRIFVRKLKELQQQYEISSPQSYQLEINSFDFYSHYGTTCDIKQAPKGDRIESKIRLTLTYLNKKYIFDEHQEIDNFPFSITKADAVYYIEEKLTDILEKTLFDIEKSLEIQSSNIFKK